MATRSKRRRQAAEAAAAPGAASGEGEREQDEVQSRRILRSHYRALKTAIAKDKGQSDAKTFTELISTVDNLYKKAHRPRELIADAEAIYDISSSLLHCVKSLGGKSGFTPQDFVDALLGRFGNSGNGEGDAHINWASLVHEMGAIFPEAPGLTTMLGPLELLSPKKKRVLPHRKRERPGPSTKPEQVAEEDVASKSETDKNMETMFMVLRRLKKVRLDALLLNRKSFAQTVENLFALSFLVKDGRVQLEHDQQGECSAVPKNAPSGEDRASSKVQNLQFVFRFDFADWKFMQAAVEPGAELMPHRNSSGELPRASLTPIRKTSRNRARETCSLEAGPSRRLGWSEAKPVLRTRTGAVPPETSDEPV